MRQVRGVRLLAVTAVLAAVPLSAAARAPQQTRLAGPVAGGTLRIVAAFGPDHLDPVPANYTADFILERAYARQLLSYPAVPDRRLGSPGWRADITPVPDVATVVPTIANGGITNGGRTYTLHIRRGVAWQTGAAVTSADFLREFKAFCNPVPGAFVAHISYFETIVGMKSYCDAEAAYFANPARHPITAANVANFRDTHTISGIATPSPTEIQFTLARRASDFLYFLALPYASARPASYDHYLPDSAKLDQHLVSDGPYEVTSYVPGRSIGLSRNPAWKQSSDPIRHQYASKITVTIGVPSPAAQIAGQRAGKWDLVLDTAVPRSAVAGLRRSRDFHIWPWSNQFPYIVFNLRSPNQHHAMGRLGIRRAVEYGMNKAAVQKLFGGPALARIVNSALPPGNFGSGNSNLYRTKGGRGSPSRCSADLARAGYRRGLKLRFLYLDDHLNTAVFQAVQASLSQCGITLVGMPKPPSSYFTILFDAPANNQPGTWDLAAPGWISDWFGNNGRSILAPLFIGPCALNSNDYGCYHSAAVNTSVTRAEAAPSQAAAATFWRLANDQIMKDAAIVPMLSQQAPIFASGRIRENGLRGGVVFLPNIGGPDVTNIWLKNG
jgi:peptide/nickel transport system substrate-binding protein